MKTIPLPANQAHFKFKASLNGNVVDFRMNWLDRFEYYSVDISLDGVDLITGIGLHPDQDLIETTDIGGTLILSGSQPTVTNLGIENKLVYRSPDD